MKRLLIVDDEHHIVNWLAELFEEHEDFEFDIFKAYSGKDALQILRNIKIDILLLDIKMPGISGLQVSEQAIAYWPNCRIILLTGYSNFDNLYYAARHKHISYLLKTESDEEILKAVSAAIESIDSENKYQELVSQTTVKEKIINHLFVRNFLSGIFQGKSINNIARQLENSGYDLPIQFDQPLFFLYGKLYVSDFADSSSSDPSDSILLSIQATEKVIYGRFQYTLYDYNETTFFWFLQPIQQFPETQSPILYLKESFDDIISFYKENSSFEIVLLLYHKAIPWDSVYNTFLLLNQFAVQTFPLQCTHSYGITYTEMNEHQSQLEMSDNQLIDKCEALSHQMIPYFTRRDYRQFSHFLKQIAFISKDIHSMHYLPMIEIYQRTATLLITHINKYHLSEQIATQIGLYPLYYLNNFENWHDAFHYLDQLVTTLFNLFNVMQLDSNQKLIISIQNYIQTHLAENLTLSTLANVVNYNSSYISRIFKQITGMKLSDYVTACRIDKTKELLLSTNESVQIIAKKVGFDSSQYLSTVFRDKTGLTPGEFRRQQ